MISRTHTDFNLTIVPMVLPNAPPRLVFVTTRPIKEVTFIPAPGCPSQHLTRRRLIKVTLDPSCTPLSRRWNNTRDARWCGKLI